MKVEIIATIHRPPGVECTVCHWWREAMDQARDGSGVTVLMRHAVRFDSETGKCVFF